MAILSLWLIQVMQLSVTGEALANRLGLSLPVRLTDYLDMTIAVDWDVNHKTSKQIFSGARSYYPEALTSQSLKMNLEYSRAKIF